MSFSSNTQVSVCSTHWESIQVKNKLIYSEAETSFKTVIVIRVLTVITNTGRMNADMEISGNGKLKKKKKQKKNEA